MSEITSITVVVPVTNLTDEIDTLRAKLAAAESRAERLEGLSHVHAAETARRAAEGRPVE